MSEPAVRTDAVSVRYDDLLALDSVTMEVPSGASVAVIGPNGCGKSTLLKTLAGIVKPSAGSFHTGDQRPAIVLQSTEVDRSLPLRVIDAVSMARYPSTGLFGRMASEDRQAIQLAMQRTAVDDLASRQLQELSGGQRQRVLIAQGLAQAAPVLLLDEPMIGLDVSSRAIVDEVLEEERASGTTTLVTTHSFDDARNSDLVLLLATQAIAFGQPSEVLAEEHLRAAFGGRFIHVGDTFILDDPHHGHDHSH